MRTDEVQDDSEFFFFQRLIIAFDNYQLEEKFQYELCTYLTALFDSPLMLR